MIIFFFFRNGLLSSRSFQSWSPCHSIRSFLTSVTHSCTTKQNGGRCLSPQFTSSGFTGLWVTSFGQEENLGIWWQSQFLRNWGFLCVFYVKKFWRLNKLSISYVSKQCFSKLVALSYIQVFRKNIETVSSETKGSYQTFLLYTFPVRKLWPLSREK